MNHNTIAIIVAAGSGSRFGADMPKQFCNLAGRPLLMTTIEAFDPVVSRNDMRLVLSQSMVDYWMDLCATNSFKSPEIIIGGATRHDSVKNAIDSLTGYADDTVVMIHDGARPFPSTRLLQSMSTLTDDVDMAIAAVAVTDSIRQLDDANGNSHHVDRSRLVSVQTPQSARLRDLRKAYAMPYSPIMTDDASVMEAAGMSRIAIVDGDYHNIKITNPGDLAIAETILANAVATTV